MNEDKCECRNCDPKATNCFDWCYKNASYINEEGELIE